MRYVIVLCFLSLLLVAALPQPSANWQLLADGLRVTFYGPEYVAEDITASAIRYAPDADIVALGPKHLEIVRDYYRATGTGMYWEWLPGPKLRYVAPAGCFPAHKTFEKASWWGCLVRVCADTAGGGRYCHVMRVADTGTEVLEVDLPDATWLLWGYPASRGVFTGTLEVIRW